MYSTQALKRLNNEARQRNNGLVAVHSTADIKAIFEHRTRKIKHAPERFAKGDEMDEYLHEVYFVDSSGFGSEREPALTMSQFRDKIEELVLSDEREGTVHLGITQAGQFQVHVGCWLKPNDVRW